MGDVLLSEDEAFKVYMAEFDAFWRLADTKFMSEATAHAAGQVARAQLAKVARVLDALLAEAEAAKRAAYERSDPIECAGADGEADGLRAARAALGLAGGQDAGSEENDQ